MDSIERTFVRLERGAIFPSLILLTLALPYLIVIWLREALTPTAFDIAFLSVVFLAAAGFFSLGRWNVRRLRRTVETIRPAIQEMGLGRPILMVSFVLVNGLLVQFFGSMSLITMFFSSGARPMPPTVAEANRWIRPWRAKRERVVIGSRRGSPAQQRVADLGESCGGSLAYAVLRRYSAKASEPNPPTWIVRLAVRNRALTRQSLGQRLPRIIATSDPIIEVLKALVPTGPA
jgi:hypothetical protein